jgi:molecular chaperone HscB
MKLYEALGLEPALALDMEALEMTAVLNDAFRTLKDPIARAEYFLKEKGLELTKDAPPELLEEVFELNMALEELREGDASVRPQLASAAENFRTMRSVSDTDLSRLFSEHDSAPSPATLNQIRATLNRRRYIANLVRDVEKELHVHSAN